MTADEWRRLQAGDRAVFRRVYDAYASLVHYVARRHGMSGEEADEILQETFLRLYERASEVRDASRLKAWIVTLARNLAVDRLRAKRRHAKGAAPETIEGQSEALWAGGTEPQREAELMLVKDLVERIAAAHPGGETLRLFYVEGRSAKEIAAQTGEAISTVTTRLSRLRERFKDELRGRIEELRQKAVAP